MMDASLVDIYQELAQIVGSSIQQDGLQNTAIPALGFYRHNHPAHSLPCVQPLGLVLAVQGSKQIRLDGHTVTYGVGDLLFTGADMSGFSYVPACSPEHPFLGIVIRFELALLTRLAREIPVPPGGRTRKPALCNIMPASRALLDGVRRLVHTLTEPILAPQLARLAQEEIALRLLGTHAPLCGLLHDGSATGKIIQVMAWMKEHYATACEMNTLAARAHMSPSTFRQHFKQVAGISPLQYQKQLRLQEARALIRKQGLPVAQAATRVGYESPSQFSREYRRYFGTTAQQDRQESNAPPDQDEC